MPDRVPAPARLRAAFTILVALAVPGPLGASLAGAAVCGSGVCCNLELGTYRPTNFACRPGTTTCAAG